MRRVVAILTGVLVLLAIAMMYSVWRESREPLTHTPDLLETGRIQLHAQLEEAKKTEAAAEQQGWNSPGRLRTMVQGHEQRIEKLTDNREAAEIVAYDQSAVDRLEKRIAQIAEEQAAKAEAAKQAAEAAAKQAARESQP